MYNQNLLLDPCSDVVSFCDTDVADEKFDIGAVILLNGARQKTANDSQNPETLLISKKTGKKIKAGDKLQVVNPNGTMSQEFTFTGS